MRAVIVRTRRLWESITEPRHLKVAYLGIYLLTVGIGLVTLMWPPRSIEGPVGSASTALWACLFILGGVVGAITVLPGWWWIERLLAIVPIGLGLLIYVAVVVILHFQGLDQGASRLTQLGVILLAATPFALRFRLILEYTFEPRRG